jgi:hypothetical protein
LNIILEEIACSPEQLNLSPSSPGIFSRQFHGGLGGQRFNQYLLGVLGLQYIHSPVLTTISVAVRNKQLSKVRMKVPSNNCINIYLENMSHSSLLL